MMCWETAQNPIIDMAAPNCGERAATAAHPNIPLVIPLQGVGPKLPCVPVLPVPHNACQQNHHPAIGPLPIGGQTQTICQVCLEYDSLLLGLHRSCMGLPFDKLQYLQGGANAQTPPGNWTGPPVPNPPWPGFLTALCEDCEDEVFHMAWYYGGSLSQNFRNPSFPATPNQLLRPDARAGRSYRWPLSTCTCLHTLGAHAPVAVISVQGLPATVALTPGRPRPSGPGPNDNTTKCLQHRVQDWPALVARKDANDRWLRSIARVPGSLHGATLGMASKAILDRRDARGTYRPCPCGKEVHATGIPYAFLCMG